MEIGTEAASTARGAANARSSRSLRIWRLWSAGQPTVADCEDYFGRVACAVGKWLRAEKSSSPNRGEGGTIATHA
jgi:hypothetical protein